MVGMTACWRCGQAVTEPPPASVVRTDPAAYPPPLPEPPVEVPKPPPPDPQPVPEPPAPLPIAVSPPAEGTAPLPVQPSIPAQPQPEPEPWPLPPTPRRPVPPERDKIRVLRLVATVLASSLLVVIGLLALAMFSPSVSQDPPGEVALEDHVFSGVGLILGLPSGWRTSESGTAVTASDRNEVGGVPIQGVRAALDDRTPTGMAAALAAFNRSRTQDYEPLETNLAERVRGADAIYHAFLGNDLRYEQWWIEHEGGSLWMEFWSHQADDNARVLHRRILDSMERL